MHAGPRLNMTKNMSSVGTATHDVGKTVYRNELTGPGTQHEEIGPQLLPPYILFSLPTPFFQGKRESLMSIAVVNHASNPAGRCMAYLPIDFDA